MNIKILLALLVVAVAGYFAVGIYKNIPSKFEREMAIMKAEHKRKRELLNFKQRVKRVELESAIGKLEYTLNQPEVQTELALHFQQKRQHHEMQLDTIRQLKIAKEQQDKYLDNLSKKLRIGKYAD